MNDDQDTNEANVVGNKLVGEPPTVAAPLAPTPGSPDKFRKRPVVIEAVQFTEDNKNRAFNFIRCSCTPTWDAEGNITITIQTLEGAMVARLGDWIIKGVHGEFYPCKPDIFAETYERENTVFSEPSSHK